MRKCLIVFLAIIVILAAISACGSQQVDHSAESNGDSQVCIDDTERFDSEEEFIQYLQAQKNMYSTAQTGTSAKYYVLKNVPEGYGLYKITAGTCDVGFWYLPSEYLVSDDMIRAGEAAHEYFMLISPIMEYSFPAVLSQNGLTEDNLIGSKYYLKESTPKLVWEHDGLVMSLYFPTSQKSFVTENVESLCELEEIRP